MSTIRRRPWLRRVRKTASGCLPLASGKQIQRIASSRELMAGSARLEIWNLQYHFCIHRKLFAGRLPMKRRFAWSVLVALVLGLCVPPVFAQASGTVKGVCRDQEGNPIAAGTGEWLNSETGRKYTLKLNTNGEYVSLRVSPVKNKVPLCGGEGKEIFYMSGMQVGLDQLTDDMDLQKEA